MTHKAFISGLNFDLVALYLNEVSLSVTLSSDALSVAYYLAALCDFLVYLRQVDILSASLAEVIVYVYVLNNHLVGKV